MGKYQEVEAKFPLFNKKDVIIKLNNLHLEQTKVDELQCDRYYTPYHKDFLDNEIVSEWFRVRETKDKCSVNFKQWLPIGAKIQDHCNEYETKISDPFAFSKILELLDFVEIITVNKTRNSWIYEKVEISIDHIDSLGDYIELESINQIEEFEVNSMHEHFLALLKKLGAKVGERDRRGYPYLMIDKKRGR